MSNNTRYRNNIPLGGRGGRGGHSARESSKPNTFGAKKPFERKFREENKKELSLFKKENKEMKDFKVILGGDDTEKVILPSYEDDDRDKTLLILIKEFNMMIEDRDIFKDEDIGEDEDRYTFAALKKRNKLKVIKETSRKFRACLKGEARDKWLKLIEDQPILTSDNYEVDKTYEVKIFFENQTSLVSESLNEDAIETTKAYLQETKKLRSLKIENYIRRVKTLNNYITLMEKGTV